MTTKLQEDYADIVVGDDGLLLVINGEIVASESCDLTDEADCNRAEDALAKQAAALGYDEAVNEGTFDASTEKGGKVVNGDEYDDWQKGETYYARRYRRRTSNAETGKPMMPAIESWQEMSPREKADYLAWATQRPIDEVTPLVAEADKLVADAAAFAALDEKFGFKKKADDEDPEDDEEVDDEEDSEDEDDMEEALIGSLTSFLADHVDPNQHLAQIREFDRYVAEGDYEAALGVAETLAVSLGQLDEYKRMTGSRLSRFRRSLKMQTSAEKLRNRNRRKEYRTNATMRRKASRYRMKVKRFMRHEADETKKCVNCGKSFTPEESGQDACSRACTRAYVLKGGKGKGKTSEAVIDEKAPLGSGGRFKALKAKLGKRGASNPGALAAYIGRKKYGKAKFASLSRKGRMAESVFDDEANVLVATALLNQAAEFCDEEAAELLVAREIALGLHEADGQADDSWKDANDGKEGPDVTFQQAAAGVFGDLKGSYTGFAGLKERVEKALGEAVNDARLMRVVSEFVNRGLVTYTAGKGYRLIEVEAEQAIKLAKAARTAGNKFVVTIAGGSPIFLPTQEDAKELWKSLPPKMRGMKTTLAGYLESLGAEESEEVTT